MTRIVVIAFSLAVIACGRGSDNTKPPPTGSPQTGVPAKPPDSSARQPSGPTTALVQPVDPEVLKTVLPEVIGWTRDTPRGEMMTTPVAFSRADARYQQREMSVQVEVQDTALNQILLAGMSMFLAAGFEERSAEGYKKSGSYRGHAGFEEWNSASHRGEINIVIAGRFIVTGVGQRLDRIESLKQVVIAVDLAKLASLK